MKHISIRRNRCITYFSTSRSTLKLFPGFVQDFGKVEYIGEINPDFDATYDAIATNLGVVNEVPRKAR